MLVTPLLDRVIAATKPKTPATRGVLTLVKY